MTETYEYHGLKPDLAEAQRFLSLLDPAFINLPRPFDFRTFDDVRLPNGKRRYLKSLLGKHRGKLEDVFEALCGHQRGGAGVFYTANRMDGKGCLAENVSYIRGVWIDDDNERPAFRTDFPLEPTIIVESSPGRYHYYWPVQYNFPLEKDIFDGIMLRLSTDWDHDRGASGVARVMRLPGFYHCKGAPFQTRIVGGSGQQIDLYELIQAFPPIERPVSPLIDKKTGEFTLPEDKLLRASVAGRAMANIPDIYCDRYDTWLEIGFAINHEFGDAGFSIWDDWSSKSDKYDYEICVKKWESMGGKGVGNITISTLFHYSDGVGRHSQYGQPSQETIDAINRQFGRPPEGPEYDTWEQEQRAKYTVEQKTDLQQADSRLKPTLEAPIDRWDENVPKPPEFLWGAIIPKKAVTLLVADGGTGKSLFAQMMMTCVGAGHELLGIPIKQGAAIGLFGEDPDSILYERQKRIEVGLGISRDALRGKLFIQELVEFDVTMWTNDEPTLFFADIETSLHQRPDIELVIIDNSSISFGGNENARGEVHDFLRTLNQLASKYDVSFVLLHHTSKSQGVSSYMAASGSTAWVNGARCVLRLCAATEGKDAQPMKLQHIKHNYSQQHDDIDLHWHDDIIKPVVGIAARIEAEGEDGLTEFERIFLKCLARAARREINISGHNSASNFAPAIFKDFPEAVGVSQTYLKRAVHTLLDKKVIGEEEYKSGNGKTARRLVLMSRDRDHGRTVSDPEIVMEPCRGEADTQTGDVLSQTQVCESAYESSSDSFQLKGRNLRFLNLLYQFIRKQGVVGSNGIRFVADRDFRSFFLQTDICQSANVESKQRVYRALRQRLTENKTIAFDDGNIWILASQINKRSNRNP